jgi:acetyltransferase
MGKHYLNPLFAPKSVAVFGASDRVDSVGQIVFKNMLDADFRENSIPSIPRIPKYKARKPTRP